MFESKLTQNKQLQLIPLTLQLRRRADKSRLTKQIREFNVELSKISQLNEFAKYSKVQRKMRASLDSLKSIQQMDLELKLKYTLVAQAFSWLLAVILTFRLLYKLYVTAVVSLGLS